MSQFGAKRKHLKTFQGFLPESQGQNLALTVLFVPNSLESGLSQSEFGLTTWWVWHDRLPKRGRARAAEADMRAELSMHSSPMMAAPHTCTAFMVYCLLFIYSLSLFLYYLLFNIVQVLGFRV